MALLGLLDVNPTSTPPTIKLFETAPILEVGLFGSVVKIALGDPSAGVLIAPDLVDASYDAVTGILTLPPLLPEELSAVLEQILYVPNLLRSGGTGVTITVIDVATGEPKDAVQVTTPSGPTDIGLSSSLVPEGAATGFFVGQFSSTDPDQNETFTYTLLSDAGGRFALEGKMLKAAAGILLDFEQATTHQISVRVTDKFGFTYDEVFTIALGDVLHEVLTGTAAADTLVGGAGNDQFFGIDGNDLLVGGAGNDVLAGGSGADSLSGGLGDDVYYADRLDLVMEAAKAGTDTVLSLGDFTLAAASAVENLFAQDAAATTGLKLTGNQLNNRIVGNAGANTLNGGKGNDAIQGGAGKDKILGGLGNDVLTGGAGKDAFVFHAALNRWKNVDKIVDFKPVDDVFHLENRVFKGLKTGTLSSEAFHVGTAAADADDRIVYDKARGAIYFDRDGDGVIAAVKFAQVKAGTALTVADFFGI